MGARWNCLIEVGFIRIPTACVFGVNGENITIFHLKIAAFYII